jgi:hypothetical protein
VIVLLAVGVVLLLLVGAIVALVALSSGDDEADKASDRDPTTVSVPTTPSTEGPSSTELPGPTDPPGTEPPSTDVPPTSSPTPTLPGAGTLAPPDGFPDPPGARESITGGIEVPGMTAEEVGQFYEDGLPGAGYTVDRVDDLNGIVAITVSGPEDGVLSITSFAGLPTTVIWTAL